ncbi:MAG TPA: arginine deiminase-related protein, partial [Gemmatimonadales bacterium]|nr:arginine deiminase-related protein [Gemmatimonadales bacterium]
VAFTATDRTGVPFYHTNVLMFIGHGLAGICLESIGSSAERRAVEERLQRDGKEILPLTQEQTANFCGNCLALSSGDGTPLLFMSSQAWRFFSADQRATIERHGRILHTELSAFERLGGGSARCLVAELF